MEIRTALARMISCMLCLLILSLAALSGARQALMARLEEERPLPQGSK